ncbi:endonuclease domain-containing 1 protein-like [Malaclemys terrapin pileata]|uniref:endonuclease domain-containing 1 protein-like n=1 Tax=Malaclemys terrapin pileata TaxID=2991368 RepID=UPI0023A838EB|nr:endonuclease domain-containing 1 protein-like [Malaclemys terrapin pileata]
MSHRTMDWLMLLGCVSLWAGLTLAEVGSFSGCTEYFYQGAEPRGFATANTAEICQRYNNRYHFATLYDRPNRIPRWSAYTLGNAACSGQPRKRSQWFVEPQLAHPDESPEMTTEADSTLTLDERRSSQAINEDYEDPSYDRGHLNPNTFQCNDSRMATFTLTNAAPMDPCFNRIHWYKLEKTLKTQLTMRCRSVGGTPYLVTGAVPSDREKSPIEGEDKKGDRNRPYNRVSVPSHIWTAVCCDHRDNNRKFSFAFIGENQEASSLQIIPVEQLNAELSRLYKTSAPVEVFADDFGSESQKGQEVLSAIKKALYNSFQNLLTDPYSQLVKRRKLDRATTQGMTSKNLDQNNVQLTRFLMDISSLADGHSQFEKTYEQDDLAPAVARVARASGTSDPVCPFDELNFGVTSTGWSCVKETSCACQGYKYSWCYTSDKNDWDYCCTEECTVNPESKRYECPRGDGSTTQCSPHGYSMQTISGTACQSDHPCGLYGKRYFWCYTDDKKKWDYCCSPQHYCGNHGYGYQWCYIQDPEKSWQYCTP